MLNCHDVHERLVPFVLDDTGEDGAAQINDHLAGCVTCRQQERLLLALIEKVRDETVAPGEALRQRIRNEVASQSRATRSLPGPLSRAAGTLRRPVPAYLLAAACLVGVVATHRLPPSRDAQDGEPIGRVVTSGQPARFVVANPYETALDARPSHPDPGSPPAGGSGSVRVPSADSL
jgi:hypothetical protein